MWSDVETFERICATREERSAVLGFIGQRQLNAEPLSKVSYVPCPDCKQLMNRSNFAKASGVIIDTCKKHGVWFDAGELPQIIEFIQKGGMEISRQRERSEIEADRNRIKDEQRNLAVLNRRLDESDFSSRNDEHGIRGFLSRLLD
jgi:Zn-finger nucleic acid-binding protein